MNEHHAGDGVKLAIDVLSAGVAIGTIAALLPPLAALLTILWTAIRIYETATVQRLLGRGKDGDA